MFRSLEKGQEYSLEGKYSSVFSLTLLSGYKQSIYNDTCRCFCFFST